MTTKRRSPKSDYQRKKCNFGPSQVLSLLHLCSTSQYVSVCLPPKSFLVSLLTTKRAEV